MIPRTLAGSGPERPAVFLDRDGTLIREKGYLKEPGELELEPGAAAAVRLLNRAGIPAVLVTNQSGIARGYFTERDLDTVHRALHGLLAAAGARLDGVYVCPHHPEARIESYRKSCTCRKPAPGMLQRAVEELGLGLGGSYLIGDKRSDMQCAREAGVVGVLVTTGYGMQAWSSALRAPESWEPDLVAGNLLEAVTQILEEREAPAEGMARESGNTLPFPGRACKFISLRHLTERLAAHRARGRTVVLANGVFDLFRAGHVGYLQDARKLGDLLVVAVNDDRSARARKGPSRPLFPAEERFAVLSSLSCVDHCVLLRESTADRILDAVRPDIYAQGTDCAPVTVPERDAVERFGGRVEIVGPPKRCSTTGFLESVRGVPHA